MSGLIKGSVERGEGTDRMVVEITGKLSRDQWEAFKQELARLGKTYGLAIESTGPTPTAS
jgi:hypothetical protein